MLVYSCSGCSDVAQLANEAALRLDHAGVAEMSCIAGVGGGVPALVKTARSGRPIMAIDGCRLHCVLASLERVGVQPSEHVRLYERGYRKRRGLRYSEADAEHVVAELAERIAALDS
ncbi:putative lipoprotein [Thioalkalivibrio nitratireducens DSM 14787]|uniref:Lipoprotein n=1 Tax=Thioalkalivibrio nitratireducens (strain DSM 14787 / UNIQEM 213 / ALEN2) TaxID=1255043 RepID=L0DYK4_THIND|nr:putative lipoprotein [Thioalkalivibrio nitratireducens DSM 14787]